MIGLMDSGNGGLTIFRTLVARFPNLSFVYLGDHANAPYGNRPSEDIIAYTQNAVELLFERGCRLVILACNTATAVACRTLQQNWLPNSKWKGHNVLGIIAPTVEAATQTPWAVTTPQYPQKNNTDLVAIFATERTVASNVYPEEIRKRCPKVRVVQQVCPDLAGAIEQGASENELDKFIQGYMTALLQKTNSETPHRAILGCTHFPLVEPIFRAHLPLTTRLLTQSEIVADSLEDYLERNPQYLTVDTNPTSLLLTTGEAEHIAQALQPDWGADLRFERLA